MAFYIDAGKNGSSGEIAYLLKKCILHCPKNGLRSCFYASAVIVLPEIV